MRYLQEITDDWKCDFRVPCHTYILEDGRGGRMLGYIKEGTNDPIWSKRPIPFDRRNRKFKELKSVVENV